MMAGFQAEENLTGRASKKCAKNSGRYLLSRMEGTTGRDMDDLYARMVGAQQ